MNKFITCPTNCAATVLPILDTNQDCFSVEGLTRSEITGLIFLSKKDSSDTTNPLPAAVTLAGLGALIDNTDTTGSKAKHITVSGVIGAPEESIVTLPKFKEVVKDRTYTLTADVQQLTTNTYEFIRTLQCGGFVGYVWFVTEDWIFGGTTTEEAITIDTVTGNFLFEKGKDSYQNGQIIVKWKSVAFPDRAANWGL